VEYILSVAIPRPLDGLFTYKLPESMLPEVHVGGWVKVPFGRVQTHAFIVEPPKPLSELASDIPLETLKEVIAVGDHGAVVPEDVLALCRWAHDYYLAPLGEVLQAAVPSAVLGLKRVKSQARPIQRNFPAGEQQRHVLTPDQEAAVACLDPLRQQGQGKVALLEGVTGSGKTEVYLEIARRALQDGRGVILLVPEIALTPQLHQRFEQGLGEPVALWHSAVADGKRRDEIAALRSGEIRVVVGARSAVFAPVRNLGLIVVDEEHDPTYKQEDRVRYHARDLAIVRSKLTGGFTLLGSATPSMETRERVREGKFSLARLDRRIGTGGLPSIELVDLALEEKVEGLQAPLAASTLKAIQDTVAAGEQAMIFLNRRGFAAFLLCQDCGEVAGCPECSISLTVHKRRAELRCHVCGHQEKIPDTCEKCQGSQLQPMGAGTESLEADLPALLPGVRFSRLDRDQVTSATRLESILQDFRERKADVLLGTQMLVKGHDFPGVTLVVVILADALFRWPDFRATERAIQILKQVAGRAGRAEKPGKVLIQTFDPDHAVLKVLLGQVPEDSFLETERQLRQGLGYPPFGRMARIRLESRDRSEAIRHAEAVAAAIQQRLENGSGVEILGPSEAFLEKAKGTFRWDILLKGREIRGLQRAVWVARDLCARQKWPCIVDVDPYGF